MRFLSIISAGLLSGGLLLGVAGCTDPYLPEAIQSPPSYLVVDGYLNARGTTTIKLSRTYAIGTSAAPPAEARATVYLEEEGGPRTLLREAPAGTYSSPTPLTLNPARRYRLQLRTSAGKEYASDFVPVKLTPPIDAVNWQANANALDISVDTHDPANNTRYYRWDYIETWEIHPPYSPTIEYVNKRMRDIAVPFPTTCWGNASSTNILLYQTTALSQDVVSNVRVRQLQAPSPLLFLRYSILVQQQALTKPEYDYWELQRKNTESIGSLFDPQPVQLTGNVHCLSNPAEPVLGFVGAHSVAEKRIFIARRELPQSFPLSDGYEGCVPPDTVFLYKPPPMPPPAVTIEANFNPTTGYLPIEELMDGGIIIGYTTKKRPCIDCRLKGTSTRPSFW